jgi:hypothetical protein
VNKGLFFCLTLVLFGLLDLATTVVGITCCGAVESNPLLSGITMASPLVFSIVKLLAITAIGFMFYRAGSLTGGMNRFIQFSYLFSMIFMTYVVTNNVLILAKFA